MKQFTEPIVATLDRYRTALREHPLLVAARTGQIGRTTLLHFAYYQYADSITWIPMLAQLKHRALRSQRLRDAIEDNIGHEAGIRGYAHVQLAAELMRGLGVRSLAPFPTEGLARTASLWLTDAFAEMSEPAVAGWLYTAETLVPDMFAIVRPLFTTDARYFDEHIHVDADEHAQWMREAVEDVIAIYGPDCVPEILAGMADAWDETCEDPDALWRSACASR